MSPPRTVVLIGALSLAGGWLIGTTTAPTQGPAAVGAPTRPRPIGVPPGKGGVYTEQLRQKLNDQPRSPLPGRNPFIFGSRGLSMSARPRRADPPPVEPTAALELTPAPIAPRFKFSGVASSEKDGVATLTAILVDSGTMVFAKAGDTLSGGHRIVRVEEKAVVIVDAAGAEQTLRLP